MNPTFLPPADGAAQLGAEAPDAKVNTSPAGEPGLFNFDSAVVPAA